MKERIDEMIRRHDEITEEMNNINNTISTSTTSTNKGNRSTVASLGKELSSLSHIVGICRKRQEIEEEIASVRDLLQDALEGKDMELQEECEHEIQRLEQESAALESQIVDAALPHDEDDYQSDALIEVRAGTGGDEASLFAGDLVECYMKTAKALRWKVEIMSQAKTDLGGIKEASFVVSGGATYQVAAANDDSDDDDDNNNNNTSNHDSSSPPLGPYGTFKFESGVHRVQRVPINDSRIHTSACSVAVLPTTTTSQGDDQEMLPMSELRIETMRASGAGGQHVNTTDSAVRIVHLPTGITAAIQDERSQHKNKEKALQLIAARVRDLRRSEEQRARGEIRSLLMGGGDRSERIRTYNWPQDRITDHRTKESKHGIANLLNGSVDSGLVTTFLPGLKVLYREELMQQVEEGGEGA